MHLAARPAASQPSRNHPSLAAGNVTRRPPTPVDDLNLEHLERWCEDLLTFAIRWDAAQGPCTVTDAMLHTRIGRPALLAAVAAVNAGRWGWTVTVDERGVIALERDVEQLRPPITQTPAWHTPCRHDQVTVNEAERLVTCQLCGILRDPIDVLATYAANWSRLAAGRRALERDIERLEERVGRLKHDEKLTKARLHNAREQLRIVG